MVLILNNLITLKYLINQIQIEFDFICITKSRLIKSISPATNINLNENITEHTPTESSARGAIIYINEKDSCQPRNDLKIYKQSHLESIFAEIILPKRSNIIIGCIYRHPSMDIWTFNDHYLNPLLERFSKENYKKGFLIGDFNIDLLKFDSSEHINRFINGLSSNCLHPQILLPTRISDNSKTIIDNMFSNIAEPRIKNVATGNITFSISDHFPQFFFFPDFFSNNYTYKKNAEVYD